MLATEYGPVAVIKHLIDAGADTGIMSYVSISKFSSNFVNHRWL